MLIIYQLFQLFSIVFLSKIIQLVCLSLKITSLKMTILAPIRVHFKILGILPLSEEDLPPSLRELKSLINFAYNLFWYIALTSLLLTVVCFMVFEASTFLEYAETTFYCSVSFLHLVSHIILVQAKSELHGLFKDSDKLVRESGLSIKLKLKYLC